MTSPARMPAPNTTETPSARFVRFAREQEMLAEAEADYAAGRFTEGAELDRWLAWFASDAPDSEEPGRR